MKTGLRYFIGFLCLGLAVISGIWLQNGVQDKGDQ